MMFGTSHLTIVRTLTATVGCNDASGAVDVYATQSIKVHFFSAALVTDERWSGHKCRYANISEFYASGLWGK